MKVLIAGGGVGGLTAALALLQQGIEVTVLEQAPALLEVGAGVQLSPNATRTLGLLGLGPSLAQWACVAAGKRIRLWNSGQSWTLFDLGAHAIERYGHPYLTMHRGDLQTLLAQAVTRAAPGALRLGAQCLGLRQDQDGVELQLANGETLRADALIGADGVHSKIRASLLGDDAPEFSGCRAWRGVIQAQALPPHLRTPEACNWVGPGAHVIHYPLRRGELVNFVGIIERGDWQRESWTEQGRVEDCRQDFAGWHEDVQTLINAVQQPFKQALMVREPLARWSWGRATLLGDAAHPTLPMLASGAAMAIEDGYILARCLQAQRQDIPAALQCYAQTRLERTARVVRGSADAAKRFHNPELGNAAGASAYVDREWSEDRVHARYDWLFSYRVDEVALGSGAPAGVNPG